MEVGDQPFDAESVGDSEDADLSPLQSGEDWVAQLDDDLSRLASQAGETFRITALQLQDTTCTTCMERKSPTGRHHPLGNIPTGHRWDQIAMDILDVCDPTPDG